MSLALRLFAWCWVFPMGKRREREGAVQGTILLLFIFIFRHEILLTCGILGNLYNRSKEVLSVLVDWKCCMLLWRIRNLSPSGVPACIQLLCWPKIKQISHQFFDVLPGVCENFLQSTKTHSSRLPRIHNEPVCWRYIQKPNLRWYFLMEIEFISNFHKTRDIYRWNQQWKACYWNSMYSEQEPRFQLVMLW